VKKEVRRWRVLFLQCRWHLPCRIVRERLRGHGSRYRPSLERCGPSATRIGPISAHRRERNDVDRHNDGLRQPDGLGNSLPSILQRNFEGIAASNPRRTDFLRTVNGVGDWQRRREKKTASGKGIKASSGATKPPKVSLLTRITKGSGSCLLERPLNGVAATGFEANNKTARSPKVAAKAKARTPADERILEAVVMSLSLDNPGIGGGFLGGSSVV
jgi:hypothetical protein